MTDHASSRVLPDKPRGTEYEREDKGFWCCGHYAGLPILADSVEIHEQALALLQAHVKERHGILDIAAGAGALTRRLLDNGFTGLEALELRPEALQAPGVPVHALNLDSDWAAQLPRRYHGAVALGAIEHLENPWHFARQCAAVLRPGGVVVIAIPNIESSRSRIEFLLRAEFRFFSQDEFKRSGHITSLTTAQLIRVFAQAGLEFLEQRLSRHKGVWRPTTPRRLLRALLYALSYPFMRGAKKGEIRLFAFRRPEGL
jgi:2-polyprenyl-3-methyl-5-hydroxy-6-metoxy-1,4-benzoquinol methylase